MSAKVQEQNFISINSSNTMIGTFKNFLFMLLARIFWTQSLTPPNPPTQKKKSKKKACHFQQRRIIDVSIDGKGGQKGAGYGCTQNAPPQLKMNPFTSQCLLCTFGRRQIKEGANSVAGASPCHFFSMEATFPPPSFQCFKNLLWQMPWKHSGREKGNEKWGEWKEEHSNICRSFQTDSWDVNNSTLRLPWPLWNKGEGAGAGWLAEELGVTPAALGASPGEQDLLSLLGLKTVPPRHPPPHAMATVIAAAQRSLLTKSWQGAQEWNINFLSTHTNAKQGLSQRIIWQRPKGYINVFCYSERTKASVTKHAKKVEASYHLLWATSYNNQCFIFLPKSKHKKPILSTWYQRTTQQSKCVLQDLNLTSS